MFSLIVLCLFSFAALSPAITTEGLPTQTVLWEDVQLELPEALVAAPLSGEAYNERTYLSEDGAVELVVRRSTSPTVDPVAHYHAALEQGWAADCAPVALLDKSVDADGYRLEWLTGRAVVIERAYRVLNGWVLVEASAPREERVTLRRWLAHTHAADVAARP